MSAQHAFRAPLDQGEAWPESHIQGTPPSRRRSIYAPQKPEPPAPARAGMNPPVLSAAKPIFNRRDRAGVRKRSAADSGALLLGLRVGIVGGGGCPSRGDSSRAFQRRAGTSQGRIAT